MTDDGQTPDTATAYALAQHGLHQPYAVDAPWARLTPQQVPAGVVDPTVLCRCVDLRPSPWGDPYGQGADRYLQAAVRLRRVRVGVGDRPVAAYLIGRCGDCGTVWWAALVATPAPA